LERYCIYCQVTSIPNYVLAVNFFKYYHTLLPLSFPSPATVFNIFPLGRAIRTVPDDLLDEVRSRGRL
jgi:ABC-type glycerol-3-phosphate transport system permease component